MLNCSYVPNIFSISRIFLTVVFIFCIIYGLFGSALVVFVVAAVTDLLDGYIARKWHCESRLGSILDPAADKCLMIFSYIILGLTRFIPLYATVVVVARDISILLVVVACKFYGVHLEFRPLYSSKVNTTLQLIYVIAVLTCRYFFADVPWVVVGGAIIVTASTVFSAVEYARNYYWIKDAIRAHR